MFTFERTKKWKNSHAKLGRPKQANAARNQSNHFVTNKERDADPIDYWHKHDSWRKKAYLIKVVVYRKNVSLVFLSFVAITKQFSKKLSNFLIFAYFSRFWRNIVFSTFIFFALWTPLAENKSSWNNAIDLIFSACIHMSLG